MLGEALRPTFPDGITEAMIPGGMSMEGAEGKQAEATRNADVEGPLLSSTGARHAPRPPVLALGWGLSFAPHSQYYSHFSAENTDAQQGLSTWLLQGRPELWGPSGSESHNTLASQATGLYCQLPTPACKSKVEEGFRQALPLSQRACWEGGRGAEL